MGLCYKKMSRERERKWGGGGHMHKREREREKRPTKKQKGSMIQSEITLVMATNMKKMK